ncbi:MAG: hypothetical protein K2Y27_10225 [Xanthobacteraceae bacterium]|nr:hypothetical protein [Xanthobacteraceae bacterium]
MNKQLALAGVRLADILKGTFQYCPPAMDLFNPVVAAEKLHQNFQRTLDPTSAGVRAVLSQWAEGFQDRDGKFVREFQTTYNSSFWELYLFAVLKQLRIAVDFSFGAPDFVARDHGLAIEAVIASHAQGDVPEWEKTLEGIADMDLEAAYARSITRLANAITAKSEAFLQRYASLPHMKGRSYIVAVSNYGTQDFNMIGDMPMQWLLYDHFGRKEVVKPNGSRIELGWFNSDRFAHISGVMYSSVATFGKARALGNDQGEFVFHAIRIRNNHEPIQIVAKKAEYSESLTDGLRLYVNPYAAVPLDIGPFADDDGIRKFFTDPEHGVVSTCHPDGDLCMRMIQRMTSRRADATPSTGDAARSGRRSR